MLKATGEPPPDAIIVSALTGWMWPLMLSLPFRSIIILHDALLHLTFLSVSESRLERKCEYDECNVTRA